MRAVEYAADIGFERVEFYTGPFAHYIERNDIEKTNKIKKELTLCIDKAKELNLGINAGHDLNLVNLSHLKECGVYRQRKKVTRLWGLILLSKTSQIEIL